MRWQVRSAALLLATAAVAVCCVAVWNGNGMGEVAGSNDSIEVYYTTYSAEEPPILIIRAEEYEYRCPLEEKVFYTIGVYYGYDVEYNAVYEFSNEKVDCFFDKVCWFEFSNLTYQENVVVTIEYLPIQYTIFFDVCGGTPIEPISHYYNGLLELPTPYRRGCDFEGWLLSDMKFEDVVDMIAYDVEIVAKWAPSACIIYFINFDNLGLIKQQSCFFDDSIELPIPADAYDSFFSHWSRDGNKLETSNGVVNLLVDENQINITAIWEIKRYNIFLNVVEGIVAEYQKTVEHGSEFRVSLSSDLYNMDEIELVGDNVRIVKQNAGDFLVSEVENEVSLTISNIIPINLPIEIEEVVVLESREILLEPKGASFAAAVFSTLASLVGGFWAYRRY